MSGDKKPESLRKSPIEWVFRASLLLFGTVIALNLTIAFLRPILPSLIGGIGLVVMVWLVVAIARWRRSRW